MYSRVALEISGPTNDTQFQRIFHNSDYSTTGRTYVQANSGLVDVNSPLIVDLFQLS